MHLAPSRLQKNLQLCLAVCALLTWGTSASNAQQVPQLILYTPLNIDGTATTATTTLQLLNPNPSPIEFSLSIQCAVAKNTNRPADWVVAFYDTDQKPAGPMLAGTIAGHKSLSVRVDLSHLQEAGETVAELRNNNVKIAELRLVKEVGLPFKVTLEGNPTEKPEIQFVNGTSIDLHLKNDDPMNYPVEWELSIKGRSVSGTGMLGPNGTTRFTVTPDAQWFSLYESFFKSESADGTLRVGYKPPGATGSFPSKTIPIKAQLNDYAPERRDIVAMLVILVILAIGGIASSYVNVDLVNRIKAIGIEQRIGQVSRVIGEIGPQLNSQLRVALWLERGRIGSTLPRRVLFTPETAAVLVQSVADMSALEVRVAKASEISEAILRLNHAIDDGVIAPTISERVNQELIDAQDLLKKSVLGTDELQKVQSLVGDAINLLNGIGKPDAELEKTIVARLQGLTAFFTPALLAGPICQKIQSAVPIPFTLLTAGAHSTSQVERDEDTRKLEVIADLVQMKSVDAQILAYLKKRGFVSLSMAEQLDMELKEGVSLEQLGAEIEAKPPRVYFVVDRDTVRVNTPIMMKLMFDNWDYNRAAAKRRIECTWNFDHNNLTESGWEVHHYFPEARAYSVKVKFTNRNRAPIVAGSPIERALKVVAQRTESYSHNAVEFQRWAVGFLVAVLGLFVGAKDKIVSLDTMGAVFAVFLLGFGIDMAKNLLVPKT
jgi:hypothetical protein